MKTKLSRNTILLQEIDTEELIITCIHNLDLNGKTKNEKMLMILSELTALTSMRIKDLSDTVLTEDFANFIIGEL